MGFNMKKIIAALLLTAFIVPAHAAGPLKRPSHFLKEGAAKETKITAWHDFCKREPDDCKVNLNEPDRLVLDKKDWAFIKEINESVNTNIIQQSDILTYGVADYWTYPDNGVGDCEDLQLLKRRTLKQHGFPLRAMRMVVVLDEKDEGHAVLLLRTSKGDYILDNMTNKIKLWYQTGYTFKESEGVSGSWVSLALNNR